MEQVINYSGERIMYVLILYMFIGMDSGVSSVVVPTQYYTELECKSAAANAVNSMWTWDHNIGNKLTNKVVSLCVRKGIQP